MAADETKNLGCHGSIRESVRAATRGLLAVGIALTAAMPALAASPTVEITVVPVPTVVSYARPSATPPLVTRAAYEIRIVNQSTNTINDVRFLATSSVLGATATAPFAEAIGMSCQATDTAKLNVLCSIGQLRGGGGANATASFVLVFNAPPAGSSIQLNWTAAYGEGLGDSTGANHVDTQTGNVATTLGTPTATDVRSYVPTGGATLFTGLTGVASSADPWTTVITVPSFAKAEVLEDLDANSCSPDYVICVRSTLTIPGSFSYLLVKLRRDVSTLKAGAKIANAVLRYQPGSYVEGVFVPSGTPVDIVSCDLLPGRVPNASTRRCVDYRLEYTKKNSPSADYVGDWEFGLKALENGRVSW